MRDHCRTCGRPVYYLRRLDGSFGWTHGRGNDDGHAPTPA